MIFTYNTNAIEGSKVTPGRNKDNVGRSNSAQQTTQDVKETEAHAKIFLDMLKEKEPILNRSC